MAADRHLTIRIALYHGQHCFIAIEDIGINAVGQHALNATLERIEIEKDVGHDRVSLLNVVLFLNPGRPMTQRSACLHSAETREGRDEIRHSGGRCTR